MARRVLAISILLVAASFCLRCGSSSSVTPTQTGTLYAFIGDNPVCDVLSARFNITQLLLYFGSSASGIGVLSSLNTLIPIDLAEFRDRSTVLNESTVNAGTYDRISIGLAVSTMYLYNPSANPPITSVTETLTSGASPTFNISPPLVVPPSGVAVVSLDFDLGHSLQVNSQGQATGVITPFATATAPVASAAGSFGEVDGVNGFIESVSTTPFLASGVSYTGAVTVQLLPSTVSGSGGPALTAQFTNKSTICGPTQYSNQACCLPGVTTEMNAACSIPQVTVSALQTASYTSAEGFVDTNGFFENSMLFLGPQESVADQQVAFVGPVLSVTRDTSGNVTGFNMFLRQSLPAAPLVPLDELTAVTISSNTLYNTIPPPIYSTTSPGVAQGTNFAALPFGPDQITVGQDVVVHGVYTVPPVATPPAVAPPASMVANEIDLNLQTHEGNFVSLLSTHTDNRTGAFAFQPCAMLDQQNPTSLPIYVFTSSQTTFVNTAGLSSLQSQPSLLVKGLLFLEPQGTTINGVTVPAGQAVMLAKQVTQIQ